MQDHLHTAKASGAHPLNKAMEALNDVIERIQGQNKDDLLTPLITEAVARGRQMQYLLERSPPSEKPSFEPLVDTKVFHRLMALAGPSTAIELLDQLLVDLGSAEKGISAALQREDWPAIRRECHVLVAVSGSIGANQVMVSAEALHRAVQRSDAFDAKAEAGILLGLLEGLIFFVKEQRRAKTEP